MLSARQSTVPGVNIVTTRSVNPGERSGLRQLWKRRDADHIPVCLVHSATWEAATVAALGGWRAASSGGEAKATVTGTFGQESFKGWDKSWPRSREGDSPVLVSLAGGETPSPSSDFYQIFKIGIVSVLNMTPRTGRGGAPSGFP